MMSPCYTVTTEVKSSHLIKTREIRQNGENNIIYSDRDKSIPQYDRYKFLFWEFETPLIWTNIIGILITHILCAYVLLTHPYLSKPGIVLYAFFIGGLGGFGITAGAHRYYTHRSFKAKLPLRIIFLICYSIAGQNSLLDWVRDHRVHHKFTETDGDPHNSHRGFFFAHVGWLMMRKHPEVIRKGRQIDCSDIFEDPFVVIHQKYFLWFKVLLCFILPTVIPPLVWGESWAITIKAVGIARYILNLNFTWLVNSAAHLWGTKPYDRRIHPVENLTVSLLAMGEGYHNYHHTFPWDYRASELGRSLNLTTFWLNMFQKIGWAYEMQTPTLELVKKVARKHGDGSHFRWGHEVPQEENEQTNKCL